MKYDEMCVLITTVQNRGRSQMQDYINTTNLAYL